MTRVKICGLTREEDVRCCVDAGVHALGFIVEYPIEVPWNLNRREARALMRRVPPFVSTVVVVGDDPGRVVQIAEFLRPQAVQLHGSEPLSVTREIAAEIRGLGIQVIKALRFSVETGRCGCADEAFLEAARSIEGCGVDGLLLDSVSGDRPAGTGRTIDWAVAGRIRRSVRLPVILAGGLHAGNVGRAVAAVDPYGVDVISGVENPVGVKDPQRIRGFVEAACRGMP